MLFSNLDIKRINILYICVGNELFNFQNDIN